MTNQDNEQEPVSFSRVLLCQYGGTLEQRQAAAPLFF